MRSCHQAEQASSSQHPYGLPNSPQPTPPKLQFFPGPYTLIHHLIYLPSPGAVPVADSVTSIPPHKPKIPSRPSNLVPLYLPWHWPLLGWEEPKSQQSHTELSYLSASCQWSRQKDMLGQEGRRATVCPVSQFQHGSISWVTAGHHLASLDLPFPGFPIPGRGRLHLQGKDFHWYR